MVVRGMEEGTGGGDGISFSTCQGLSRIDVKSCRGPPEASPSC